MSLMFARVLLSWCNSIRLFLPPLPAMLLGLTLSFVAPHCSCYNASYSEVAVVLMVITGAVRDFQLVLSVVALP